jgi:hypothetical protein
MPGVRNFSDIFFLNKKDSLWHLKGICAFFSLTKGQMAVKKVHSRAAGSHI